MCGHLLTSALYRDFWVMRRSLPHCSWRTGGCPTQASTTTASNPPDLSCSSAVLRLIYHQNQSPLPTLSWSLRAPYPSPPRALRHLLLCRLWKSPDHPVLSAVIGTVGTLVNMTTIPQSTLGVSLRKNLLVEDTWHRQYCV